MKRIYLIIVTTLIFSACADDPKIQEKALQKQIMDVHEKVMANDEKAMNNKMKLDTLLLKKQNKKDDEQLAKQMIAQLNKADDAMSNWMRKFNPDYSGKSHNEVMVYLQAQLLQVKQIDAELVTATKQSSDLLKQQTKK